MQFNVIVKCTNCQRQVFCVQVLAVPLTSCVTLEKLINVLETQFLHLENEFNSNSHLIGIIFKIT
jgi:hypothetical protein